MRPARVLTLATLIAASAASCAKRGDGDAPAATATAGSAAAKPSGPDTQSLQAPVETHRKVIHTGRVELIVVEFDAARTQLDSLVSAAGGYVDSADIRRRDDSHFATIVLRIPADGYGDLIGKLGDIGQVASESTTAADVTDQYVDVAARLASTQTLEKRLLELATDRTTGTVDQVLAIERELGRVRGEIETYEGHIRQWDDRIAMSTLTVTMYPGRDGPVVASLRDRSSEAFHGSLDGLRSTGAGLLIFAIAVLPWAVILVPSFFIGRRLWRRSHPRLPKAAVQPPRVG
jgi:hypothetical protein